MDKCAFIHAKKGKFDDAEKIILMDDSEFSPLPAGSSYKYLGIEQSLTMDHSSIKKTTKNNFMERIKALLTTKLYSGNLISAINAWAIPVLTHTFGVLRWTPTDLERIDRQVRTTLTKYRCHHPNASMNRLYLPRKVGGRGLLNLKIMHEKKLNQMYTYFSKS